MLTGRPLVAAQHGVVLRPAGPDRARRGRDPGPPVPGRPASRSREQIVAAREEERRRLRRELHDGLAPTLAGAGLKLDLARQSVARRPAAADGALDEARADVRTAIAEIRRMARDLRPPTLDALGLEGALREQAAGARGAVGRAPVIIVEVPEPLPALPAAVEVAAYRIAVEAMLNVVRHAAAQRCEVRLSLGRRRARRRRRRRRPRDRSGARDRRRDAGDATSGRPRSGGEVTIERRAPAAGRGSLRAPARSTLDRHDRERRT